MQTNLPQHVQTDLFQAGVADVQTEPGELEDMANYAMSHNDDFHRYRVSQRGVLRRIRDAQAQRLRSSQNREIGLGQNREIETDETSAIAVDERPSLAADARSAVTHETLADLPTPPDTPITSTHTSMRKPLGRSGISHPLLGRRSAPSRRATWLSTSENWSANRRPIEFNADQVPPITQGEIAPAIESTVTPAIESTATSAIESIATPAVVYHPESTPSTAIENFTPSSSAVTYQPEDVRTYSESTLPALTYQPEHNEPATTCGKIKNKKKITAENKIKKIKRARENMIVKKIKKKYVKQAQVKKPYHLRRQPLKRKRK
jgi:hypothetical protein